MMCRTAGRIDDLTPDEEAVLRLRFARVERLHTPAEVAELLGVSLETARRIESRALRKLRLTALGPLGDGFDGWDEV